MSFKIEGINGNVMEVDGENRAQVLSTVLTEEHHVSQHEGDAYMMNSADTDNALTLTATEGPILFLRNNSSTQGLIVQDIFVSSDTAGVIVILRKNMTLGTIGNENLHTPVNLNFESGKAADALAYNWDQVGDGLTGLTSGTIILTDYIGVGLTPFSFGGVINLAKDDNIVLSTELTTAEFTARFRFYFDTI